MNEIAAMHGKSWCEHWQRQELIIVPDGAAPQQGIGSLGARVEFRLSTLRDLPSRGGVNSDIL